MRLVSGFGALFLLLAGSVGAESFEFKKGEHISLIGNALADRMQNDGWLEAYLQTANPGKDLVIRNMGFTGDTVAARPREEGFPAADQYLSHVLTDVVFAFFGYNESYERDPEKFKGELRKFIDDTLAAKYNGKSAPRLVLFSPIAHEDLRSKNFPDGKENNLWLSIYTDAMARVAAEKGVPFVDLYGPSKEMFEGSDIALTINGVHLNETGNQRLAQVILKNLGQPVKEDHIELVRQAVLEKNWCWFNRYRATDGNDVYGNRSVLKFVDGQTNADVLMHELVMLDVMSANRDKVIFKAVQGQETAPDDSNVPPPVPVKTDFTDTTPGGSLKYVPASEGVGTLKLQNGLEANLFASEEQFPELVNPVQMDVDTKGRLWVADWQTYPKWEPDQPMLDRLLILPDDNHDGVADKAITFAFVHNPTGFTFWNGGVIVASVPNLLFLKDTDGDDVADIREVILGGLDSADTHHSANGFDYGPDGYIYYQRGVFNVSNVETPWEAAQLSGKPGMYRFNPRTHRFSFHADNSPNSHGGDFNYWGYHFATDATTGNAFQVRMDGGGKFKMHPLLKKTVRPVPSSGVLSSMHFPPEAQGNYLILNSIGFLGIKQYTLENKNGEFWGTETDDLLVSSDPNFRPTDFKFGDDGALYVADWNNAIIGHMQHNVRDPSRDHAHGRVYRITCTGRPLQERVEIDGQPIPALLEVLKHPTDGVRLRARIELSEHDTDEVLAAVNDWVTHFDASKAEDAHPLLEALWLYQQHDTLNEGLLGLLLNSPDPDAKRAAERVKYMWEIEGKIGDAAKSMMDHMAHMHHEAADLGGDYLKQEKSPEPKLEGDTMVVHIQTLKEQMKYDRKAFAVKPGMKVKLIFKNPDAMDHNWVLVQPGASTQVAMAATMLGADGIKLNWLPKSDKIIVASKVLAMGEETTLEFTAPTAVGTYPYICTYPGHYMLMNGVLHVVDDLEKWAAENKDTVESQAAGAAPAHDWKVAELSGELGKLDEKRNLQRGEEVFKAASCAVCHLPGEKGGRIGPDLGGVAERLKPDAMLVEILEPSAVINEQFKAWQIRYESEEALGEDTIIGLVTEETDSYVRVVADPLHNVEGVKVPKDKIQERTPAPLSTMPTGLLSSYSREDILDLMAYARSLKAPAK